MLGKVKQVGVGGRAVPLETLSESSMSDKVVNISYRIGVIIARGKEHETTIRGSLWLTLATLLVFTAGRWRSKISRR